MGSRHAPRERRDESLTVSNHTDGNPSALLTRQTTPQSVCHLAALPYLSPELNLMAVEITLEPNVSMGIPRGLFEPKIRPLGIARLTRAERALHVETEDRFLSRSGNLDRNLRATARAPKERLRNMREHRFGAGGHLG